MQPNRPLDSANRSTMDFTSRPPGFTPGAPLLVSCIRCRRLHAPAPALALGFNPICPACAGPIRSNAQ